MGYRIVNLVMPCRFGNSQRKLIAFKLADVASDDGTKIYPSIATTAKVAECSPKTVIRTEKEWVKLGLLILVKKGGKRPGDTNEYSYNMPMLEALHAGDIEFVKCNFGSRDPEWELVSTQILAGRPVPNSEIMGDGPSTQKDGPSENGTDRPGNGRPVRALDGPSPKPTLNLSITNNNSGGGLLLELFEEFKAAAKKHKFAIPKISTLTVNQVTFENCLKTLGGGDIEAGAIEWRSALAYAATDRACTGKLPIMKGRNAPWKLTFLKMCDANWLANKLDVWGGDEPSAPANLDLVTIKRGDERWGQLLSHFKANRPNMHNLMEKCGSYSISKSELDGICQQVTALPIEASQ